LPEEYEKCLVGITSIYRALQGIGAALIAPSALSMVMNLFSHNKLEMNKAMGLWGASASAGRTAGVFLGGVITAMLDWPHSQISR
jgi:MFS family permease